MVGGGGGEGEKKIVFTPKQSSVCVSTFFVFFSLPAAPSSSSFHFLLFLLLLFSLYSRGADYIQVMHPLERKEEKGRLVGFADSEGKNRQVIKIIDYNTCNVAEA